MAEGSATEIALVNLQLAVRPFVSTDAALAAKTFATEVASKRFLPGVRQNVLVQLLLSLKSTTTHRAPMGQILRVELLVHMQRGLLGEGLSADFTDIRSLPGVCKSVLVFGNFGGKRSTANITLVFLQTDVNITDVSIQAGQRRETFSALVTSEGSLAEMTSSMHEIIVDTSETLGTIRTLVVCYPLNDRLHLIKFKSSIQAEILV